MKRTLIVGTILLTAALLFGAVYYPNFPLMWLAGTTVSYEIIRGVLLAALIAVLVSKPPRSPYVRYFLGGVATSLAMVAGVMVLNDTGHIIDVIVFIESAIILALEALETSYQYATVLPTAARRKISF